jgi:ribosomal protein S8
MAEFDAEKEVLQSLEALKREGFIQDEEYKQRKEELLAKSEIQVNTNSQS